MINIKLISKEKLGYLTTTELEVNGKPVLFQNKIIAISDDLTEAEEKAAIWFMNCDRNIKSSVL